MSNHSNKIRAGITGGAGYTGGELIRLLLNHPDVDLVFIHSKSNEGNPVYTVHQDLAGETDMVFSGNLSYDIDVLFLCLGHGESKKFLQNTFLPEEIRIIDLSQDFRVQKEDDELIQGRKFVYGLPEIDKANIQSAENIANPGCFATAIQLAVLPLASVGLLPNEIHVSGITGSTGAGRGLNDTTHFSWRNNNVSAYKVLTHQHVNEVTHTLHRMQGGEMPRIRFVPYRGNFSRGILATTYLSTDITIEMAEELYAGYYFHHPFVHINGLNPHVKQVVNTNKCIMHLEKHDDTLVTISVIDNLLKGASGQAVQNMNLMFGLDETAGLKLKAMAF